MRKLSLAIAPFALAIAACETYPPTGDPYPPSGYPPYQPGPPTTGDYRAIGTEPFWDLTIGRDMVFTDRGTDMQIVQPTPPPAPATTGRNYRTQRLDVTISRGPCSDGMSDRSYADTVQVYADGRLFRGCGGPSSDWSSPTPPSGPAPTLDRTRWSVEAVNGRRTPPGEYFMEFDGGRLSAKFGCNGLGAGYTQTGNSLDAGAVIGTRMACPDMSFENDGSRILDQLMTIQMVDNNRMALVSSAGRIDLVRR